jgi:hypothetical protein
MAEIAIMDLFPDLQLVEDRHWRVKETPTHYVDVLEMIWNYRIVTTPKSCELVWDRGWCYQGKDLAAFLAVMCAAMEWDGSDETEPEGYFKVAGA